MTENTPQQSKVTVSNELSFEFVQGRTACLARTYEVGALRAAVGDLYISSDPRWFVTHATEAGRRPWMILMRCNGALTGAVLLKEKLVFGIPLLYFTGSDCAGDNFIIAAPGEESRCLYLCLDALMKFRTGALFFLSTRDDHSGSSWGDALAGNGRGSSRYRLELASDYEATLKAMGAKTRKNLRYYTRQLLDDGAVFYPDFDAKVANVAAHELRGNNFCYLGHSQFSARLGAMARQPGSFAIGLRAADGEWLSYLTGWRQEDRTFMFFQMNHEKYARASLSTAMRACFIRHETERGAKEIIFVDGTSVVLERACRPDIRHDLLIGRQSLKRLFVTRLGERLNPGHRLRGAVEGKRKMNTLSGVSQVSM